MIFYFLFFFFSSTPKLSFSQFSKSHKKLLQFHHQNIIRNFGRSPRSKVNQNLNSNKPIFERIEVENGPISSHNLAKAVIFSIAVSLYYPFKKEKKL